MLRDLKELLHSFSGLRVEIDGKVLTHEGQKYIVREPGNRLGKGKQLIKTEYLDNALNILLES